MRDTIQDALDDVRIQTDALNDTEIPHQISSPTASTNRRSRALAVLEQQLALACAPDVQDDTMRHFLQLQDRFECNIPSRTFSWVQLAATRVDALAGRTANDMDKEGELHAICAQLYQLLTVIQGIALHHTASKAYLGRRYALEILVALLTTSRHTPMITPPSSGDSIVASDKTWTIAHLSSAILDTLLCVLVDSSAALRTFEDVNGVQAVVKLLKRAGTPREVRMKCLEFLYFYLMDETTEDTRGGGGWQSMPSTPLTRLKGPRIFARPASDTLNISIGSSSSSSSRTASSQSSVRTPSPMKKAYSTPVRIADHTPPQSVKNTHARPMMMLQKDVDYEPKSPIKGARVCERALEESRVLTMEEKKEILGTLLGNVDALVEGVRKAGIWGLQ